MNSSLFDRFASDFIGLDGTTTVIRPDGTRGLVRKTYLDSAATCLMPRPVWAAIGKYLETSCANSHTHATTSGISTTIALDKAHELVGNLVGYDRRIDCVVFTGSGATGPANLLAQVLMRDPNRPIAVVSSQEHHSNILPWIKAAGPDHVRFVDSNPDGTIDQAGLARILAQNRGRVRVVAVTALSNVTGVINSINRLAAIAHGAGAEIVVDAAQAGAHVPITMHPTGPDRTQDIDYLVLSGHKLYAPGSPGAMVGKKDAFTDCGWLGQVGGGTVEYVGPDKILFKADPAERQEAGTPNIPGTIGLGVAAGILGSIGIPAIAAHEQVLMARLLGRLLEVPGAVIYGPTNPMARAAVVTFNLGSIHHGLVASALNDYLGIAVRNDCFCAQPYVRAQIFAACDVRGYCDAAQLKHRGMVRASLGVYTTIPDIDRLIDGLKWIAANQAWLSGQYTDDGNGNFTHKTFHREMPFSIDAQVAGYVGLAVSPPKPLGLLRPAGQAVAVPVTNTTKFSLITLAAIAAGGALWYLWPQSSSRQP